MGAQGQVLRCGVCGTLVELVRGWQAGLCCCGRRMSKIPRRLTGPGANRHVPTTRWTSRGLWVSAGETHREGFGHRIRWIEVRQGRRRGRMFFGPGQKAQGLFPLPEGEVIVAVCCTRHGLWITRVEGPGRPLLATALEALEPNAAGPRPAVCGQGP